MSTGSTIVELSADAAALLREYDKAIAKAVEHERKLMSSADAGEYAGQSIEKAMERVRVSEDRTLKSLMGNLGKLGPAGQAAGKALSEHWGKSGRAGVQSMESIRAQILKIDPTAAEVLAGVTAHLEEADRAANFDSAVNSLNRLGPEGSAIARGIQEDMQKAAAASAGGLDAVLAKIKELDPAAAASAERVRTELAEAARFTEGRFASTLEELRKIGPVGQQVAAEMRKHLVAAGEISERSIEDVIAKIHQIDPAAAEAAKRMHQEIEAANAKGTSSFDTFSKGAIAQITAMAGAYIGVQQGIEVVNTYLKDQEQLLKNAYDRQIDLAKAQQEAAKMLAGLSAIEQNELLNNAVPEIVRASNNPDSNAITMAIGSAVSSGANPEQARSAVLAAAKANVLTPEATPEFATAAISLARSTGKDDARENLALLVSTGAQSQLTDNAKLAVNLAPAVGNSVATVPGQDKVEASREAAAIFGVLSKAATDTQGDTSRTATVQLTGQLGQFFGDLESKRVDARSKAELLDRKIAKGSETESDRVERDRLAAFLVQTDGMSDPGTLFGRIGALQQNDAVREQFFSTGFGDAQYQVPFKQLADSSSALAAELINAKSQITADGSQFESLLIAQSRTTPQQKLAYSQAGFAAIAESRDISNTEGSTLNSVRQETTNALRANRGIGLVNGILGSLGDWTAGRGALSGGTAAEESVSAMEKLIMRRSYIVSDGVEPGEAKQVEELTATIDKLQEQILLLAPDLSPTSLRDAARMAGDLGMSKSSRPNTLGPTGEVERFDQQAFFATMAAQLVRVAEATEQQNKLLAEQKAIAEQQAQAAQQTATNTTPPARQPNFAAGQQAAAAYGSAP